MKTSQYVLHPSVEMDEPLGLLLATRPDLRFNAVNSEVPYPWTPGCTWILAGLSPFPDHRLDTQLWWLASVAIGTGIATTFPIPAPAEAVPSMLGRLGVSSASFRVEHCEPTGYNPWNPPKEVVSAQREKKRVVYFIQPVDGGLIKIGVAANPQNRLYQLQIGCPVDLKIIGTLPGGQPGEAELHERFAEHRVRGEWFEPTTELLALIAEVRA